MPYLAFDLDALKKVPDAARSAGLSEEKMGYGLLRMWGYCWTEKRDRVKRAHLAGFFDSDSPRVEAALEAFDFTESDGEDDFRVRGTEKYLRIQKAQSDGGKKASNNLRRGIVRAGRQPERTSESSPSPAGEEPERTPGSAPALTPSTEHRTPIEKPPPTPSAEPQAPAPSELVVVADESIPKASDFEPDSDGSFQPNAWGFWGWHNELRQMHGLFHEPTPPPKLKPWFEAAVAKVGHGGLSRAYRSYLTDMDFRDRGWPIAFFMSDQVWPSRANEAPRKVPL